MATKQEVLMELRRKGYKGPIPGMATNPAEFAQNAGLFERQQPQVAQPVQQVQSNQPDIGQLISTITQRQTNPFQPMINYGRRLAGEKVESPTDYAGDLQRDLYKTYLTEQIKQPQRLEYARAQGQVNLENTLNSFLAQEKIKEQLARQRALNRGGRTSEETMNLPQNIEQLPSQPKQSLTQQTIEQPIEQTGLPQAETQPSKFITKPVIKTDDYGNQFLEQDTIMNPEYESYIKQIEEQNKPLSGEGAIRFSGSKQAKNSINDIFKLLKLRPTGKTLSSGQPEYTSDVPLNKRIWDKIQQNAASSTGLLFGQNIPGVSDILRSPQIISDEESRLLENEYSTLAEDLLRARTGATAPEPEIVREFARSLNRLGDSPTVVANRLLNNEQLVDEIIEQIRPGYLTRHGLKTSGERGDQSSVTGVSDNLDSQVNLMLDQLGAD